jgi:RNA polymerase sigma-70 factor, ECF subfamily
MPPTTAPPHSFIPVMTGEATAVAAANDGSEAASDRLGALFDAHHQRLYRLARRLSRSQDDARDLVQDTFLRAARAPASIPSAPHDEAWLVRVLVNLCRDRWRQASARHRLEQTADRTLQRRPPDPEAAAVARSVVWQALSDIEPRRRAVIVMHEIEGMAVEAIAQILGVTAVTVRWHLSRGRRQLAALIQREERGR